MLGVRQGSVCLVVPNCEPALAQLDIVMKQLDPRLVLVLATAAAAVSPPAQPSQQPQLMTRPFGLPCCAFLQVTLSTLLDCRL